MSADATTIEEKVEHVLAAKQTRNQERQHHCHWAGCSKQVPPAMWGCKAHWARLPSKIRAAIWETYVPGQEVRGTPTDAYLDAADAAQEWIREHGNTTALSRPFSRQVATTTTKKASPMSNHPSNRHVIIDLETTGLARDKCVPLEVACVVVDAQLQPVASYTAVINHAHTHYAELPAEAFEEGAMKLHQGTGLFAEVAGGKPLEVVEGELIHFLASAGVDVEKQWDAVSIGNNPDFDRAFLKRFFPHVESRFHYRSVDVSTLREIASLRAGLTADRLKRAVAEVAKEPGTKHRALADCMFCLAELQAYASAFNGPALVDTLTKLGALPAAA